MTMNPNNKKHKVRDYREVPFAYQDKPAFRYMRTELRLKHISDDMFRNLRTMYVALTEIASDRANQNIEAPNGLLRVYSGLKDWRTIKKCLDKLEEWAFISVSKSRGDNARFKPRSITLLSVLHLTKDGDRPAQNAERRGMHTAPDGDVIEAKDLKEIKENYKEINGRNQIKKINEMKADLVAKMSFSSNRHKHNY